MDAVTVSVRDCSLLELLMQITLFCVVNQLKGNREVKGVEGIIRSQRFAHQGEKDIHKNICEYRCEYIYIYIYIYI